MITVTIRQVLLLALLLILMPRLSFAETAMRVAVLEFADASSDAGMQALGKGLQSMVTTDLTQVPGLQLVERERLQAIVAEQKLGQSGLVDKATAAKIGQLAGATHLLGGSFTVVDKNMRLDARLFSMKTGEVLLAEQIAGERDAFFELEKALVNKLITAVGVKLGPKERAGLAKIHTADFGAFQLFAQGVAHFDGKRYDEALQSLRSAVQVDSSFQLARLTLSDYEAVVAKIRAKAGAIEVSNRQLAEAKDDAEFQNDLQVAKKLQVVAAETGQPAQLRRLAALTYLIGLYAETGRNHGRISRFQDHFDALLLRRMTAGLARQYLLEAKAVFPAAPLLSRGLHPPATPDDVEKRLAGLQQEWAKDAAELATGRNNDFESNLRTAEEFAKLMAADRRETVVLYELAVGHLAQVKADEHTLTSALRDLSEAYLRIGDVDGASGALARSSAVETNPEDLKRLAQRIEDYGKLSKLLATAARKTELRELVAGGETHVATLAALGANAGPASVKLLSQLADRRRVGRWWPHGDPLWWLAGEPVHLMQGEFVVFTGPRVDGLSSRELRYYRSERHSTKDVLLAMGHGELAGADLSCTLDYSRAPDFAPPNLPRDLVNAADIQVDAGRPEVTLLFGMKNLVTHYAHDPVTRKQFYPLPTVSYGVRLSAAGVALVRVGDTGPSQDVRQPEMPVQVLAESAPGVSQARVALRLIVQGKTVKVTVGGASHRFTLPEETRGMVGVHLRGQGYVQVSDWKVR